MRGVCTIAARPSTARTTNHTTITGPNKRPIFAVPRLCITKSPIRIDQRERNDQRLEGAALVAQTFHGAEHRDRGRQHAVAEEQRQAQNGGDADGGFDAPPRPPATRCASAASASTPPSPSLSARMMRTTYLIVTTIDERPEDQRQRAP